MSDYNTTCPKCGDDTIYLIAFSATARVLVCKDGWALDEGPCSTTDEIFECSTCQRPVPADYVMKSMNRAAAVKIMTPSKGGKR